MPRVKGRHARSIAFSLTARNVDHCPIAPFSDVLSGQESDPSPARKGRGATAVRCAHGLLSRQVCSLLNHVTPIRGQFPANPVRAQRQRGFPERARPCCRLVPERFCLGWLRWKRRGMRGTSLEAWILVPNFDATPVVWRESVLRAGAEREVCLFQVPPSGSFCPEFLLPTFGRLSPQVDLINFLSGSLHEALRKSCVEQGFDMSLSGSLLSS